MAKLGPGSRWNLFVNKELQLDTASGEVDRQDKHGNSLNPVTVEIESIVEKLEERKMS